MRRKLDLRTGRPVWFAYRAPRVTVERLTRDVSADVVIVGMGISGAMMAEALSDRGLSVICIDRRGPLLGSTPATTALVQFEIDEPLTSLAKMIGRGDTEQAWRRSRLAVHNLRARIAELETPCDLTSKQSLYLAGNKMSPGQLRQEADARNQAGIRATYLTAAQLRDRFGIERDGAILSDDNLAIDPRKLTAGLLNRTLGRKGRLFAPVEAVGIDKSPDRLTVLTKDGPALTARFVVLATGYELMDLVPSDTHTVISTWAIATKPQPRKIWPGAPFIWEASDPYLYMRATEDGRVICGGEDEDFQDTERRDALLPRKAARISEKLAKLFPHLDVEPEFAWTGSFGTTTTGLPYMGMLPGHPRIFAVQGYGGNGITFSQIASELVCTAIAGGNDSDNSLFAYGRTGILRTLTDIAGRITG